MGKIIIKWQEYRQETIFGSYCSNLSKRSWGFLFFRGLFIIIWINVPSSPQHHRVNEKLIRPQKRFWKSLACSSICVWVMKNLRMFFYIPVLAWENFILSSDNTAKQCGSWAPFTGRDIDLWEYTLMENH